MSASDAYERLMPSILELPKSSIQNPNLPPEEKVMEGKKLKSLIERDREPLLDSGLDPEYLDSFTDRLGAYEIAEAKYIVLRNHAVGLGQQIKDLQEKLVEVRKVLLHYLTFVLKDDAVEMATIEDIKDGRTLNNKVFDIQPLIELAKNHVEELEKVKFDRAVLDDAERLYEETSRIKGLIKSLPKQEIDVKDIRNRAYTYLNEAFVKIKEHAQFVFWKDEEKLKVYKSEYLSRSHSGRGKRKKIEMEPIAENE